MLFFHSIQPTPAMDARFPSQRAAAPPAMDARFLSQSPAPPAMDARFCPERAAPPTIDIDASFLARRAAPPAMDAVHPVAVWADNFQAESAALYRVARCATHVAFNIQYPGCIVHGDGTRHHHSLTAEERYALVRANVNSLRAIQVGLAVRTDDGSLFAWEFNLCDFDILRDAYYRSAPASIAYLASRGVDFYRLMYDGVPGYKLRWLLRDSGLIRACPEWTTFAGGYHVAYLVKILTGERLPADLDGFMDLVRDKIGAQVYDVKVMAREHDRRCRGPLKLIAKHLVGAVTAVPETTGKQQELAGAAAVLALRAFEALKDRMGYSRKKYRRQLSGIQTS